MELDVGVCQIRFPLKSKAFKSPVLFKKTTLLSSITNEVLFIDLIKVVSVIYSHNSEPFFNEKHFNILL